VRREIPREPRQHRASLHDGSNGLRLEGFGDARSPNSPKYRALRDGGRLKPRHEGLRGRSQNRLLHMVGRPSLGVFTETCQK